MRVNCAMIFHVWCLDSFFSSSFMCYDDWLVSWLHIYSHYALRNKASHRNKHIDTLQIMVTLNYENNAYNLTRKLSFLYITRKLVKRAIMKQTVLVF